MEAVRLLELAGGIECPEERREDLKSDRKRWEKIWPDAPQDARDFMRHRESGVARRIQAMQHGRPSQWGTVRRPRRTVSSWTLSSRTVSHRPPQAGGQQAGEQQDGELQDGEPQDSEQQDGELGAAREPEGAAGSEGPGGHG